MTCAELSKALSVERSTVLKWAKNLGILPERQFIPARKGPGRRIQCAFNTAQAETITQFHVLRGSHHRTCAVSEIVQKFLEHKENL